MTTFSSIIPAQIDDLSAILAIFKECTKVMLAQNIGQWHYDYPAQEAILEDIKRKEVFIWQKENSILGTITLNAHQNEQYQKIKWKFSQGEALVIHRLAVLPDAQGRKIGWYMCRFAEQYARENQFRVIRLDAYSGNPYSHRLYQKLDYHLAEGHCWFHDNELPFNCWEKEV